MQIMISSFYELDFLIFKSSTLNFTVKAVLHNENLCFSIVKSYLEMIVSINFDAVSFVKDVTDCLSCWEGMESNSSLNLPVSVSQSNQELASRVGVEVIISVPFDVFLGPYFVGLSSMNDGWHKLVLVSGSVHGSPEGFSVAWVISTSIVLLATVVDDGDTSSSESKN